jgi:hypothetical protein
MLQSIHLLPVQAPSNEDEVAGPTQEFTDRNGQPSSEYFVPRGLAGYKLVPSRNEIINHCNEKQNSVLTTSAPLLFFSDPLAFASSSRFLLVLC